MIPPKTRLCFEGGGVLGYAYAGAIIRLHELGGLSQPLEHLTGASVGSIASVALACGATPDYIRDKILGMDLRRFRDGGCWLSRAWRLIFRYGSHKGDAIEAFIGGILQDLTGNADLTFQELYESRGVELTIPYVSTRYRKTCYANHRTEPTLKIRQAARWSSTIPIYYQASRRLNGRRLEDLLVDGGVTDNYPLHVLRRDGVNDASILGFKLINTGANGQGDDAVGADDKDYGIPKNVVDYVYCLVDILREQALRYHVAEDDWKLTCKIDVGRFKTTDFDLTDADKEWLYQQGYQAVDRYFSEIQEE